jgi:TetR/AcrR family transcriptional regulator, ethionamide resistance regulator
VSKKSTARKVKRVTTASPARSGRGRRSTRPSGEDREAAILRTAELLLETNKFADISVDDLAKGAGLSRPTFYFYFSSKEAVLLTLLDRVMVEANSRLGSFASILPADRDASLRAGINAFFATFAAHPAVCAAAAEVKANSQEVRELWADFMQRSIDHTTGVIEAERAKGDAPVTLPAHELSTALNLMNEAVMTSSIVGSAPSMPADRILDTLVFIWRTTIYGDYP